MKNGEDVVAIPHAPETITPSTPTSSDPAEEDLTTRALRFLSTASPETIGGIAVGLAVSTYLVLGRLGLVLIGAAGGIVLHAAWERQSHDAGSSEEIRREKALDVVKRILDLREAQKPVEHADEDDDKTVAKGFEGFQPETAAALNELVDAVIRDYVKWWYHPILPVDQSFPTASRTTLTRFILAISQHLSRKRHADTFLDFLTNSSSIVIVFLNELSSAISASQGNMPPAEAVYAYLSANPESNLANVLNEKQQSRKFNMVAEDILQNFLEKPTYDCDPARIFLREILGGLILQMTLTNCSKPEWINGWIVYLLEDGEPDFSQAIDAGMGGGHIDDSQSGPFHDFDGNVGNIGLAKPIKSAENQKIEMKGHKKRLSKAEEAMEEAMEEAQRLSQLIADEDAKRIQGQPKPLENPPDALVTAVEQNARSLHLDTSSLTTSGNIGPPCAEQNTQNGIPKPLQTPAGVRSKAAEPTTPVLQKPTARSESQDVLSSPASPTSHHAPAFTNFDQIIPQAVPLALQDGSPTRRRKTVSLTLHNANIIIHDDSTSSDKGRLRSKPNADYLVQIEPASSDHPGWMIVRRYPDFETLHEVLRRIAQVSGVKAFTEQHQGLPNWKEHTKPSLRGELERYLRDALWYKELAESEGMKRFLEKDQGQSTSASKNGFPGIGWPTPSAFETMGKGMLDVLTSAPKGVAEGGKAIGGGITGVFTNIGNLGQKKVVNGTHVAGRSSTSTLPRMDSMNSIVASSRSGRASEDSLRAMPIVSTQPSILPTMTRRPSHNSIVEGENERQPRVSTSARSSMSGRRSVPPSRDPSRAPSSRRGTPLSSPTQGIMGDMKLPPPPGEMPDDYGSHLDDSSTTSRAESNVPNTARTSTSTAPSQPSPDRPSISATRRSSVQVASTTAQKPRPRKEQTPLTEAETKVAVELMFAVINELYTLSSAWNIRRTLLNAAKTFLLRPSNPSLAAIQSLIQDSVIASNTSDAGVAAHILKMRANTLPTEEELKMWPAEMSTGEKENLRVKARKLLVERGVPAALSGVMGQAATGEAMGRIFDCLQVEEVAKGLMFGLLLQGVRAVTQ
ncbi:putative meiotically up-regulated gene protein [Rhexocercosporidium sp. MPI-PUGE-AT-0058]|nr:putative meiotically up-regulated gene protein [Rhexocercosporidium sp. MPI-PUGE-AT-0058]